jgi:hypothetical protein
MGVGMGRGSGPLQNRGTPMSVVCGHGRAPLAGAVASSFWMMASTLSIHMRMFSGLISVMGERVQN